MVTTSVASEGEEKVYETILHMIGARMNEWILIGTFSAIRTNDEATRGYYLMKRSTELYTVQENTVMKGVEPHQAAFARAIICDAMFWNTIPMATDLYAPMSKNEGLVIIRLK